MSSALLRAREFLPQLKKANLDLSQQMSVQGPQSVSIENVQQDQPYIEMNLSCGVLDVQPTPNADASISFSSSSSNRDIALNTSSSFSQSQRPTIEVLSTTEDDSDSENKSEATELELAPSSPSQSPLSEQEAVLRPVSPRQWLSSSDISGAPSQAVPPSQGGDEGDTVCLAVSEAKASSVRS